MLTMSDLQDQYLFVRVFEQAPIGMVVLSSKGEIIRVNTSLCDMLGYTETEFKSLGVVSVSHPEDLKNDMNLWSKLVNGEIDSYRIEKRFYHKSGEIKWGLLNVTVEREGKNDLFISQVVDITELKRQEELTRESEKLALVGQLAAGIAHEIRNPLASLRGFVQLYQAEDAEGSKELRNKVMLAEIDRINQIVSELLVLAKPGNEIYELGSIVEQLNHVVTLLEGQANLNGVLIQKNFEENLPFVYCQNNLKQVFINILKNSIEAMPNGGQIIIEARTMNDEIKICFIDQGYGIPLNHQEKLFQPFFTTKETGTGLGLMVSKRIVQNHKGTMRIESEEGKGTLVEISLGTIS